jgi:hypothetical protein
MIEERIEKKLSRWKVKYLSVGGRLVLINSVLSILLLGMWAEGHREFHDEAPLRT